MATAWTSGCRRDRLPGGLMVEPGAPGLNHLTGRLPAPAVESGRRSGGSGTAFSHQDVLLPQTVVVVAQSSAGKRSPRRTGTSSIRGQRAGRVPRGVGAGGPGKAGEQWHRAGWSSQVPRDTAAGLG